MTINEHHSAIHSKEDFVRFVKALLKDLHENADSWENNSLERFLEALSAWTEDMDGYYLNQHKSVPQQPDWKMLGDMLMASRMYE